MRKNTAIFLFFIVSALRCGDRKCMITHALDKIHRIKREQIELCVCYAVMLKIRHRRSAVYRFHHGIGKLPHYRNGIAVLRIHIAEAFAERREAYQTCSLFCEQFFYFGFKHITAPNRPLHFLRHASADSSCRCGNAGSYQTPAL